MSDDHRAHLAFSIGPVQPFIAAARRTQDLFVGSKLLSHLASIARAEMPTEGLIYPPAEAQAENITNKLLVAFDSVTEASKAGTDAAEAVQAEWTSIAALVRAYIEALLSGSNVQLDTHLWEQQTKATTALELYWVALDSAKLAELAGGYVANKPSDVVEATESMLAARKLVRNFAPYSEQYGPMSSIGGDRPALRATGSKPTSHDVRQFWQGLATQLQQYLDEQPSHRPAGAILNPEGKEQLDAISTIKRFLGEALVWAKEKNKDEYRQLTERLSSFLDGDTQRQYPSTSDVAAADLRAGIIAHADELSDQIDAYAAALDKVQVTKQREGDIPDLVIIANNNAGKLSGKQRKALLQYDGDLLFAQNISAKMLKDDYGIYLDKSDVAALIDKASKLIRKARARGVYATSPYYAVVSMDGDRMGAMLRRNDNHRELSKALTAFAGEDVSDVAEKQGNLGRIIYAGGEDVLAVFPLTTVLPAVLELMKRYRERVTQAMGIGKQEVDKLDNPLATISAGIVIAHHLTPLDFVLNEARAAEKQAKKQFGRNAVAIRILRRSGQHTTAGYQFGFTDDVQYDQLEVINQLVTHIATEKVSPRFVYDFGSEAEVLTGKEMIPSELRRLLLRHATTESGLRKDSKLTAEGDKLHSGLTQMFMTIVEQMNKRRKEDDKDDEDAPQNAAQRLAEWLGVAEFIARGGTED